MVGKYCLVTGATRGIGRATALGLAKRGARVGIVARNPQQGEIVCREIQQASGNERVELFACDLSCLASVRSLAREVHSRWEQLHVLIHCAGVFFTRRHTTVDGLETTFVVNYLSRFLLTHELLDMLKASAPARIIEVSGAYHAKGQIHFDDLQLEHAYDGAAANNQSKLANVLFTYELARELEGTRVTANCLHPGAVGTDLVLSDPDFPAWQRRLYRIMRPLLKTPDQGAKTPLYLATSEAVAKVSGQYFVNRRAVPSSPMSHDEALAERLREASLALLHFAFPSRRLDDLTAERLHGPQ